MLLSNTVAVVVHTNYLEATTPEAFYNTKSVLLYLRPKLHSLPLTAMDYLLAAAGLVLL